MKERIQKIIELKGINAGELAALLDVQRSNISHILNGRNKPGAALIEKLLLVFPDLNARWLLTGEGDILDSTEDSISEAPEKVEEITSNRDLINLSVPESTSKKDSNPVKGQKEEKIIENIILFFNDGTYTTFVPKQ